MKTWEEEDVKIDNYFINEKLSKTLHQRKLKIFNSILVIKLKVKLNNITFKDIFFTSHSCTPT